MQDDREKWSQLLQEAVNKPGMLLKAYSAFHNYSIGNQIAAIVQCGAREIEPGPINTYVGWQALGRQVKRGEKALTLCMPLTRKVTDDAGNSATVATNFAWKPRWFVLSQTEGEPITAPTITAEWNKEQALQTLNISEIAFNHTDGNIQGFAQQRSIAISPLAALPHKTLFHELAHIELGHTAESSFHDTEATPRNLREVEAEAVALILCGTLQLPGAKFCRGYIQGWLKSDQIPERSAQKIFGAADRILRAGREASRQC